jgi:hypothetical protein
MTKQDRPKTDLVAIFLELLLMPRLLFVEEIVEAAAINSQHQPHNSPSTIVLYGTRSSATQLKLIQQQSSK